MIEFLQTLGWVLLFVLAAGFVASFLVLAISTLLPKLLNRLTPKMDEEKEIAQGNVAVATYFSKVISACIIGTSIVVASALIGAVLLLKP